MKIRNARAADMPAIKKLMRKYPRQILQSNLPKPSAFFVMEHEGAIIGCCAVDIYSKKIAEVRSLVVHPDFQRKGIAQALIKKCVTKARSQGVREVLAITGAVKLFEKLGFGTFHQEKYAMLKMLR